MEALEMTLLFDYYGSLLTQKQKECFDLRHNQDLSLGEIAEMLGVSRQAVSDNLTRTEAYLRKLEAAIGCISRDQKIRKAQREITQAAQALSRSADADISHLAGEILTAAKLLEE